jgi:hypothetical protein
MSKSRAEQLGEECRRSNDAFSEPYKSTLIRLYAAGCRLAEDLCAYKSTLIRLYAAGCRLAEDLCEDDPVTRDAVAAFNRALDGAAQVLKPQSGVIGCSLERE